MIVGIASLVLAIIGVFGVFSLLPKVSISAGEPPNPNDPFSTPFTVANVGNLPIYDVRIVCDVRRIEIGAAVYRDTPFTFTMVTPKIPSDDAKVFQCDVIKTTGFVPMKSADIAIIVKFRPSLYPWKTTSTARFVAEIDESGRFRRWRRDLAANRPKEHPGKDEAPYPHPLTR